MRIIILSDYFDDRGGAVGVARATAFGLKALGYEVSVITTIQDKAKAARRNENGVDVYQIYSDYNLFWRAYRSLYNPQTVGVVRKILGELKPDVVHAHNIHTHLSYYALKLAKKASAKVFLTAHDVMIFHYGKLTEFIDRDDLSCPENFGYKITVWQQIKRAGKTYNPMRNIIIRYYLKYVDKIFAVSAALKKALGDNEIKNTEVVHNGIEIDYWRPENSIADNFKSRFGLGDRLAVFFGSRLGADGQELIISAIKIVAGKIPQAVLLLAGKNNGNMKKMTDLADKSGVGKNVINCGWLSGQDLKAAFLASNVVILPSPYFDSFPLLNLEAMACKKPVVATCFGGSRESVVDSETGFIVNPFDTETLADRIVDLLENPEKAKIFGEAGYARVKAEFGLNRMIDNYLIWY
ncbi:hypothetical protein A2833_02555 [Candidatus Azambacteria bacterium RIFCSPHIGHO2_01_FULL_44_55]|uniref:Glycosyl transferase family 1 n=1 Tax=Candidatus Azambacteria bacterium RIFCSPLOWO2_02_FULL_44_14 TaxID=1797306 RepID=A0A1F5CD27_9BACT|nr:MAG: hypothetical protein A3A18_01230 [Candidatus Azambacteria bacterium RIFCSPLOWO2_01_FULL_44_84]OGD33329.1 MAG: hypothetical protein A3C78_02125 [Candidatus Azambacteria bacterium RIFCSPHIGHO2_02_FULL_45_18]OGD40654.1 MAG: hypothetical protein A2833_02555 [Candidatus Azambacteria bacterium RIFCSPHIGHO2_01_FULL_44_55]OGD40756.1 MAG: hypothetical protein A3I30_01635 [Candidatus Azambacteria bacterium RIFCSPLOWO2_02_FULL_44_14]OGD51193.1 MAG: hypothetical protein A2608_01620 [Candidatus Azam